MVLSSIPCFCTTAFSSPSTACCTQHPENSGKASSILLSLTSKPFKLFASLLDKALFNELVELMHSPQAIVRNNTSEIIEALTEGRGLAEEGVGEEKRDGGYGGMPRRGYDGSVIFGDTKEKRNEKDKEANNEPTVTKEELLRRLLSWGVVLNLVASWRCQRQLT
ncbi:uncharacterized protein MONOS_16248 [Monocercomonoides exilis]|uniref:uncharacterized protein n=1 Tax=Monocercomonoides exilis TaxID=2049356 RepID=UPI003559AD0A|nr:hypothetical protein MONOS_16248 [Monocercomonoides exilis]|eukprot:MONOS_16248.1-p1 / transcript=MONOS_16248.1 / gene=MONOS_16248 / organism=Monocercomonoides_exilis_PA203 / gene_product=unspecified product / transcript_product=unspecified product / location=Mono_scaffold01591:5134-5628(+) / protein_length=165 / sequence_SO=supercontig / SO=protein_coding / is_pseudo=false